MTGEAPAEDALSPEEFTELLADATDTDPEELERQAADLKIDPPEAATVVDE